MTQHAAIETTLAAMGSKATYTGAGMTVGGWMLSSEFADILPLTTITTEGDETSETTRPGKVAVVEDMAAQAGVQVPAGTIAALLFAINVTELDPWHAMSKASLTITRD